MVGAAQQGRTSVGIDVNPLAAFVAARQTLAVERRATSLAAGAFLAGFDTAMPARRAVARPGAADRREGVRARHPRCRPPAADAHRGTSADQGAAPLPAAGLAVDPPGVGSYFKEGNGIKYRNRQRRAGGYVARPDGRWQLERFGADQGAFVRATFRAGLAGMLEDVAAWRHGGWSAQRVIEGNSLEERSAPRGRLVRLGALLPAVRQPLRLLRVAEGRAVVRRVRRQLRRDDRPPQAVAALPPRRRPRPGEPSPGPTSKR